MVWKNWWTNWLENYVSKLFFQNIVLTFPFKKWGIKLCEKLCEKFELDSCIMKSVQCTLFTVQ